MRPRRFHGIKRPKVRQTWNKYNLYNLYNLRDKGPKPKDTLFQAKWRAKGLLRGYHGEHVVERKWTRLFSRRLLSVTNMDPKYMGTHDGAELAAGRGSGRETISLRPQRQIEKQFRIATTTKPYMQMTFAPMERRLDIAVFRAMFASSARQARQFCVHGAVKVNGKVMRYPAYQLNPGDMFQVTPDMVLMATGKPNTANDLAKKPKAPKHPKAIAQEANPESPAEAPGDSAVTSPHPEQDPDTTDAPEPLPLDKGPVKDSILELSKMAKSLITKNKKVRTSAKDKQKLRTFAKETKSLLSSLNREYSKDNITWALTKMVRQLGRQEQPAADEAKPADPENTDGKPQAHKYSDVELDLEDRKTLNHVLRLRQNSPHASEFRKPYSTPWVPRNYMAPFAHIPRYLEVNQNVCSAVYLRHPVARVGSAEVPTPYGLQTNMLAYQWYLRRR